MEQNIKPVLLTTEEFFKVTILPFFRVESMDQDKLGNNWKVVNANDEVVNKYRYLESATDRADSLNFNINRVPDHDY